MIVFRSFEDFQLGEQHATEAVLRNHALDGAFDEQLGMLGADLLDGGVFFAALPAGISHVFLVSLLFAGDTDFFGVDDDDVVAAIKKVLANG